ncbi:MAG: hypothetical protein JWR84_2626 [Caulobacter sp.]|nr:hypothetical protein [Caulobacter sp.]
MRLTILALTACLAVGGATGVSANTTVLFPGECYDVVLQGDMSRRTDVRPDADEPNRGLQIAVTKTFLGGPVSDRIDVTAAGYPLRPKTFQKTLFLLARKPDGGYQIVRLAARERVDGRGLLARGQVEQIVQYLQVDRCPAA